ncbi:MAG: hypothetical protein PHC36_09105 [Eubacteriales bacterium]|nr:hypothetical protein [Eubacteriales bacterium]MDD4445954.1 hypothetical protein [Eubacteriales bacterium]
MSTITDRNDQRQTGAGITADSLAAVNADPKWARRHRVIAALEEYKQRLIARSSLQDRYDALCTKLYSGRSSRITGMPVNHDQFAAGDHFAEMLDEKMELERALAAEVEEQDAMELALKFLSSRSRMLLKRFYIDNDHRNACATLMGGLGISAAHVYRERDGALDELYNILYAEDSSSANGDNNE